MATESPSVPASKRELMNQTVVEVADLGFHYGRQRALHEVSFEVGNGQIFGLLGPNGGGKTTLFRILCTLLAPQQGKARVAGVDVQQDPRKVRRMIGVVFQSNSLDPQLTSEENLRCQGGLYGLKGSKLKERNSRLNKRPR